MTNDRRLDRQGPRIFRPTIDHPLPVVGCHVRGAPGGFVGCPTVIGPPDRYAPEVSLRFINPNVGRVVAARFISRAGAEAAFFVGIWGKAAFEFDASPGELALLMGSAGIASLVGAGLGGILIDRFDPKRVLIVAELAFVPSTLALVLPETIGQMTVVVAASALCGAAVMTAVASLPPFMTSDSSSLHKINSAVEAGASAAFVVGPGLGALISLYASLDWIFVLDAATSVVAVSLVAGVSLRPAQRAHDRLGAWREFRDGFRFAYTTRSLRLYLGIFTALWLSFGAFGALEPLFYRDILKTGPEALGWVNMLFGAGIVAGSVTLGRLPKGFVSARTALYGAVASGVGAVIYTGTADMRVVLAGALYWGVVLGAMFPLVRTLIQSDTPDHLTGRVMGTTNISNHIGELAPLTFAPILASSFGIQPVLVGCGVSLIILALAALPEGAAVDRLRRDVSPLPTSPEPIEPAATAP